MGEARFEVIATAGSLGFINTQYSLWDAERKCQVRECRNKEEAEELARGFNASWDKRVEAERQAAVREAFEAYMRSV
ncbi:hypothetical protein JW921_05870 [Candidatus Fermentibacterales bacterium]|nr:hypothetical protein [Candidatus Fermentibacterales bacterium]